MPIYEYSCAKCGGTIEVIQKMSDEPLKTHVGCGGELSKLISAAGFQFKGTGWYVTDYAKKSSESKESKPEGTKSNDSGSAGNGSDKSTATTEKSPTKSTTPSTPDKTKSS